MARTTRRGPKPTSELSGRFRDILEATRLLDSSTVPGKVVETVLAHLCERLGKRARCAFPSGMSGESSSRSANGRTGNGTKTRRNGTKSGTKIGSDKDCAGGYNVASCCLYRAPDGRCRDKF